MVQKILNLRYHLKYLSIFFRTPERPLINCEINLILTWSATCFKIDAHIAGQEPTLTITATKLYVPFGILSSPDNAKLLQQLKSDFTRTINWNKYHPKVTVQERNPYFYFLINRSFQGVNRLFVLPFENNSGRTSHTRYYLGLVEMKDYNVMIDGRNLFDQPVKDNLITYDNVHKIATGQGDDYKTGCLLDYLYFKNYYRMIAIK